MPSIPQAGTGCRKGRALVGSSPRLLERRTSPRRLGGTQAQEDGGGALSKGAEDPVTGWEEGLHRGALDVQSETAGPSGENMSAGGRQSQGDELRREVRAGDAGKRGCGSIRITDQGPEGGDAGSGGGAWQDPRAGGEDGGPCADCP